MDVVESKWYEMDMPLNDVKKLLSANIKTMSRSFIAAGYYMKYIRDRELFRDGGYNSIWEFAELLWLHTQKCTGRIKSRTLPR